ncbi:DinB family protein [Streptomyces misionensis]|uniref:DinB family protein n=1 Tax=Streptomyces misionensis TaxID=67331 RepID=UPI0033B732B2
MAGVAALVEWPGTAEEGVQALAEGWEHFVFRIAALGDERLLAPIGMDPGGWSDETYLKLALHALKEVTHHGGKLGLLRDPYLREGV